MKPRWDGRALWYGTVLCYRFARAAPMQGKILQALEELGWPREASIQLGKFVLRQTLNDLRKRLRRNGSPVMIGADGTGMGVRWWAAAPVA